MLSVLLLGATLSLPAHADPISWTNLDFRASGDSHLGRSSTVPGPFIGTDIRQTLSSSTQLTPVPGPTDSDDFSTGVSLPLAGSENARSADTTDMTENADTGIWSTHYRTPLHVEYGLRGDSAMINTARYVAVAPRNVTTDVRNVPFVA